LTGIRPDGVKAQIGLNYAAKMTAEDGRRGNLPPRPWDTGVPLSQQAAAMWSTPRASDGAKGGPGQTFGAGGTPLPAQASGAMPPGSAERTEKPVGSLNPEFVAWMLGYPPEWLECAPSRSSLKASKIGSAS
jgi:hypothetical protein